MSSEGYHEPIGSLNAATRDLHRALVSLQEELEAVDWYRQRMDAARDDALREVLAHNLREEIEHACMVLEWLRRHEPSWDEQLRAYLFTDRPITEAQDDEHQAATAQSRGRETPVGEAGDAEAAAAPPSAPTGLTVGSLKSRGG